MPIRDLFGLLAKRQTSPEKYLGSSVNILATGQHGAARPPFSPERGVRAFRSWVYAAATINANAVASVPLRLYARVGETPAATRPISRSRKAYLLGDDPRDLRPSSSVLRKAAGAGDDLEEVVGSHPVLDLLASANPFLNGYDLTVLRVLYGELTGNAYLHPVVDEATGLPAELWPLGSQYVEVIPCEDSFIKGYVYGIDAQRKQVFEPDEVIHFRRPNPGNLLYGLGKVEAAYGSVLANEAVHDMDLATFQNSARPDYAVVVKGTPTGDQLDRFQQQVENRLRGTRKDGSFITVTGDVQFTPLNFPPKDLAGREEIVEEIAAVFGVPVSMLKANDPNLASATSGFQQWREGTILPLTRMDEEELNQSLLPLFGLEDSHVLCYDNPVPADRAYELQERTAAVAGGWRTPNEARLEEGREPIDDEYADRLLIGGQPLGGAAAAGDLGLGDGFGLSTPDQGTVEAQAVRVVEREVEADVLEVQSTIATYRAGEVSEYAATKMLQAAGLSRSVADRIVKAERAAVADRVEKVERLEGEPLADCLERGVEVLTAEGYDADQAVAIAHSMCAGEKAIEDVDLKPTEEMAALAERGLRLREEHGRGGTEVGVARARDIKNRSSLSPETVGRMANFFGRHRVDLDAPAAEPGHDDYPSAGVVAWLLWGGDPADPDGAGAAWATRKLEEIERAREKAACGCGCGSVQKRASAYEWPEETRFYRLAVEGLPEDYERLRPKASADDDIREDERSTPAMDIARASEDALDEVRRALEIEIRSASTKALDPKGIIERVVARLLEQHKIYQSRLVDAYTRAALGGGSAGTARLNKLLLEAGRDRVSTPRLSEKILAALTAQAKVVATSVIGDTVARFAQGIGADADPEQEIDRLERVLGEPRKRAETIARTESAKAYHEGQIDAWKETGQVSEKVFVMAPGACEFCRAVAKKYGTKGKAIPIDQPMVRAGETLTGSSGETYQVELDLQGTVHPNCRCDLRPLLRI